MESSSLRQLLKSLCCNTQWKYAVFWKLKPGSPMLLSWEDGYCDSPKARDSVQDLPDNVHFNYKTRITLPGCGFDGNSGSQLAYSIGLAVANMSSLLYSYGEGVVGIVASTGRHSWAFANELKSNNLFDSPDEWQVQFAVGIQTVLLVPVVPHGVVQLGALEMVPEDLTVVAHIKGLFTLHHASRLSSLSAIRDILDPLSSFFSPIFEDLSPSSAATTNLTNLALDIPLTKDLAVLDADQVKFNIPSTLGYHQPPLFMNRENIHAFVNQLMSDDLLEITEDSLLNFSGYENVTHYNDVNQQLLGEFFPLMNSWEQDAELSNNTQNAHLDAYKFCSFEPVMDQHVGGVVDGKIKDKVMTSSLSFSIDSELHEALGPAFNSYNTNVPETTISVEDRCSNLSMIFQTDVTENMNENSMECLLDAVIGNIGVVSDEKDLNACNGFSPSSSSGFANSCQTQSRSQCDVKSELLPIRSNLRSSLTPSTSRGTSSLINEGEQKMDLGYAQSKKSLKSYQIRGRKGRADVNRPRPRDRQMIQDRVKDLREIVPNGAKCSIDALLERTIKHMLFLESVTNRAEKLRNCSYFKAASSENWNGFKSHQNDGSWAYELGGQHGFFPINVENLDQPGQMIVEMLCEEYGLFLEIAQVIKRLKLTILKGVMENRSNKTWAHFIVETYKGFQRMDILWPLMQLLQRDHNPIVSKF